ncbi:riboflavin synthase [Rhodoligotrophos appendicifer]|uniref:riboflavin synthase n=1 Tax=Rhodoligotrophos appendicifer TaxID=987056 RepID=UPI001184AF4A|nr:riboflavin synthase [Rhodoligotrophos appendicifer]
MFTGIVSDIGELVAQEDAGDRRLTIACHYDPATIALGASIACSGVCLTVIETGPYQMDRSYFVVQASKETLDVTTLGQWRIGTRINLERALRIGDELGGHLVTGHADGMAAVVGREPEGGSMRFRFRAPDALARFIAPKGSVCLDGTSLTVNEVDGSLFGVNIIPHTQEVTTWGQITAGDKVNIEIDTMARYVARLNETA